MRGAGKWCGARAAAARRGGGVVAGARQAPVEHGRDEGLGGAAENSEAEQGRPARARAGRGQWRRKQIF